jgi:hypothetical protein
MMTWYGVLLLGSMLVCIGCAGPGLIAEQEASAGGQMVMERAVPFFDAKPFDQEVSTAMSTQVSTVTVPLLVPTTLHAIPPRLGTWLAVVQERGGQVTLLPDSEVPLPPDAQTRGWIDDGVMLLWKLIQGVREWQLYKPAEQYNATLYYRSRGELAKVVFTHK